MRWTCRDCRLSFNRKDQLRIHSIEEHPSGKRAIFQCETCNRIFFSKGALRQHAKTAKGHQTVASAEEGTSHETAPTATAPVEPPEDAGPPGELSHDDRRDGDAWSGAEGVEAQTPKPASRSASSIGFYAPYIAADSPGRYRYIEGIAIHANGTGNTPTWAEYERKARKEYNYKHCRPNESLKVPDAVLERLALSNGALFSTGKDSDDGAAGSSADAPPQHRPSAAPVLPGSTLHADGIKYRDNIWSILDPEGKHSLFKALEKRCHIVGAILDNQYILWPHSPADFSQFRKCARCHEMSKNILSRKNRDCRFHKGTAVRSAEHKRPVYSCCKRTGPPCCVKSSHDFAASEARLLSIFHSLKRLPEPDASKPKRAAVIMDCEMVGIDGDYSELARISVVDYFSGETLIDRFVQPREKVRDWRTRYSGVTPDLLAQARHRGQLFHGFEQARAALFEFIDDDTILIGHTLNHDFDALRIMHYRIIDLHIMLREESTRNAIGLGLQTITKRFLNKDIQNHGKLGHDSLEDALATREVLIWCFTKPQELRAWGLQKRIEAEQKKKEKRLAEHATLLMQKLRRLETQDPAERWEQESRRLESQGCVNWWERENEGGCAWARN